MALPFLAAVLCGRRVDVHVEALLSHDGGACSSAAGDADAYGTMADCYTDMGEFEKAAVYYDKYIERMNKDGPI